MLVTFEGIEGSGKSTQAALLHKNLIQNNIPNILTREPGGTDVAEEIREILINGSITKMDGICETLLNYAARRNHIETLIKPELAKNKIVICDRFFDSTTAYQGYGHGVNLETIEQIRKSSIGNFQPNLTFLFNISVNDAFARISKRQENNRYEEMDLDFHQRIHNGFSKIAKLPENSSRFILIDATKPLEELEHDILSVILQKIGS